MTIPFLFVIGCLILALSQWSFYRTIVGRPGKPFLKNRRRAVKLTDADHKTEDPGRTGPLIPKTETTAKDTPK